MAGADERVEKPGILESCRNGRAGRTKVKSGCRTCKIRKVKCDEDRPACRRCTSTGRVCDGYGIWGGGTIYSHQQGLVRTGWKDRQVIPRSPASMSILATGTGTGTEEKGYFEWFMCRTATKLPGSFISNFWTTLLLQASLNEPAVLHAVLALSSLHKSGTINADAPRKTDIMPNEQEQFMLQHYVKAISHLQRPISIKNRTSFRVALITCVVFVCLEFLRGHFKTANIHLQNGLKILREMEMIRSGDDGTLHLKACRESTDDWIVEAFSRLHLQVELFNHSHQHPCQTLRAADPETPAIIFHSINGAWQELERLLNKVFHLTHQSRQAESECKPFRHTPTLLEQQQHIRTELARWLEMYEAFVKALAGQKSGQEEKAYQLLCMYHTMANIMTDTCLRPSDESVFDLHTNQFVLLIRQLVDLWTCTLATTDPPIQALPGHLMDMSRSIVDMGWIPLLYYAAVKCRVHRIRIQAIRLLESAFHREGIWDAKTATCVARKVIEIEERDFYKDVDTDDNFPLISYPRPQDLLLPSLPESYRIREVEVVLSGAPMDKILLFCRQKEEGIDCRVLLSEYNVHLQRWTDGICV